MLISIIIASLGREVRLLNSILQTFPSYNSDVEVILVIDGDSTSVSPELADVINSSLLEKAFNIVYTDQSTRLGPGYTRNLGLEIASGKYIHFADDDDEISYSSYHHVIDFCRDATSDILIGKLIDSSGVMTNGDFLKNLPSVEFSTCQFAAYMESSGFEPLQIQQFLFLRVAVAANKLYFPCTFLAEDISFTVASLLFLRSVTKCDHHLYTYLSRAGSTKTLDTLDSVINHLTAINHILIFYTTCFTNRLESEFIPNDITAFVRRSLCRLTFLFLIRMEKYSRAPASVIDELYTNGSLLSLLHTTKELMLCNYQSSIEPIPNELLSILHSLENSQIPVSPIQNFLKNYIWNQEDPGKIYVVCYGPLGKAVSSAIKDHEYSDFFIVDDRANEIHLEGDYTFMSFADLSSYLSFHAKHTILVCNPNKAISKRVTTRLLKILEGTGQFHLFPCNYRLIDLYSTIIDTY